MTDRGTHVPLVAYWKGTTPTGKVLEDLVDFSDFLPTLCEAANVEVASTLSLDGRSFLPQLLGKKGNPREWIYIWYARNGGPTGREFTRNQRYKLYRSGEFYDVPNDYLEKNPLEVSDLTDEQKVIHAKLQLALAQYTDARPDKFGRWKERKQAVKKAVK